MKIENAWRRLEDGHFWQLVDREHNRLIAEHLINCQEVLDLGCGYGSLINYLRSRGIRAYGVDTDPQIIERSKLLFPSLDGEAYLKVMSAEALDFPDNQFDGMVLRDTLHHLWEEGNIEKALNEIERVIKPGGTLVIFDPNPNFILKASRWIARHQDAQCTYQQAIALMAQRGWDIEFMDFVEFFALALSGGYVGVEITPRRWPSLHTTILTINRIASQIISKLGLGPALLWRYLLRVEVHK